MAAALASKMAAYTDDQGEMYVLAPLGWTCQASLGADGNDSIAVYPPGEVGTSQFALGHSWPKSAQAVTGDLLPACYACFVGQACTFFPAAEHDLVHDFSGQRPALPCPRARPSRGSPRASSPFRTRPVFWGQANLREAPTLPQGW